MHFSLLVHTTHFFKMTQQTFGYLETYDENNYCIVRLHATFPHFHSDFRKSHPSCIEHSLNLPIPVCILFYLQLILSACLTWSACWSLSVVCLLAACSVCLCLLTFSVFTVPACLPACLLRLPENTCTLFYMPFCFVGSSMDCAECQKYNYTFTLCHTWEVPMVHNHILCCHSGENKNVTLTMTFWERGPY